MRNHDHVRCPYLRHDPQLREPNTFRVLSVVPDDCLYIEALVRMTDQSTVQHVRELRLRRTSCGTARAIVRVSEDEFFVAPGLFPENPDLPRTALVLNHVPPSAPWVRLFE